MIKKTMMNQHGVSSQVLGEGDGSTAGAWCPVESSTLVFGNPLSELLSVTRGFICNQNLCSSMRTSCQRQKSAHRSIVKKRFFLDPTTFGN